MLYFLMKYVVLGPIFRLVYRIDVQGMENIPARGAVILAGNHLSVIDSFFLPLLVRRRVAFLAKAEYFRKPGLVGWIVKRFMLGVGQIPIDRSGGSASEAALLAGFGVLNEGRVLGIYPEGTRSPDGNLYRGRTGIARMALSTDCVIVPIFMGGTNHAMPIGVKFPRPARIVVRIGKPLDFSRYKAFGADRFILRSITDEVMIELLRLSDQEYVDVYASSVRSKLGV